MKEPQELIDWMMAAPILTTPRRLKNALVLSTALPDAAAMIYIFTQNVENMVTSPGRLTAIATGVGFGLSYVCDANYARIHKLAGAAKDQMHVAVSYIAVSGKFVGLPAGVFIGMAINQGQLSWGAGLAALTVVGVGLWVRRMGTTRLATHIPG
jgi:hypothetical protein